MMKKEKKKEKVKGYFYLCFDKKHKKQHFPLLLLQDSRPSLERFKEKATPSSRWLTIEIGGGQHNRQVKRNNNKTKMELASIAFWIDKSQTQKRIRRWNDKKLLISDRLF